MIKRYLVALIVMAAAGCQSPAPRVQISPEQARKLGLDLTGPVAPDGTDKLYLATPTTLMRHDPGNNRMENLLNDPYPNIRDVAVTPGGTVLVLRPRELALYMAGYLVTLYRLPGEATALSCDRDFAYVLTDRGQGARLLRIALTGTSKGSTKSILTTQDRPQALCAVRGGCLVASGGNIIKVTDPVGGEQGADSEVTTVLLVAMHEPVTSVAADQDRLILYFATDDMTYAWLQGQILPVFPAGSRLAWARDTLTICRPAKPDSQIVRIPNVSRHTNALLEEIAQSTRHKHP